jgi:large subunit ribosomal protein L10
MAMLKEQKIKFVKDTRAELKKYSVYAILPIDKLPDRLVQKIKNEIKPDSKLIITRKKLMEKIMEGNSDMSTFKSYINGNFALVVSNSDPFELYRKISSNAIKLAAKPGQISPSDITITAGETSIPPGQAVTELKSAGIDVQIQKGKVVISKTKVLVPKGSKIMLPVAKALMTLGVMPFHAEAKISVMSSKGLIFTEDILSITPEKTESDISSAFHSAYALSIDIGYVTPYNIDALLKKGYMTAFYIGVKTNSYEPGIIEKLLAAAIKQADELNKKSE